MERKPFFCQQDGSSDPKYRGLFLGSIPLVVDRSPWMHLYHSLERVRFILFFSDPLRILPAPGSFGWHTRWCLVLFEIGLDGRS